LEIVMKSWRLIASMLACGYCVHAVGADSAARALSPTDLNLLARVSDPQVSPDGRFVVYVQRDTDLPGNRGRTDLWLADLTTPALKPRRLTQHSANDTHPRWAIDGGSIYFLSARTGAEQIWRLPLTGGEAVQITDYPLDVGTFRLSPDGQRVALSMEVFRDCSDLACTHDRLEAIKKNPVSGRTFDSLLVRHWDTWNNGTRANLFVAPMNPDGRAGAPVNVSRALDADVPSKPSGGDEEYTFSPDGTRVVFSARVAGREEAWSTNFDLYQASSDGSGAPKNLTADNPAWDTQPNYLANGDLAWLAMSRPGFEADRFRIKVLHAGVTRDVASDWDRSILHLSVTRDGRTLLASANDLGQTPLFSVDPASSRVRRLSGPGYVGEYSAAREGTVVLWHDLGSPPDLYLLTARGEPRRLTAVNSEVLAGRTLGTFEQFSFKGWNDETVYGYVVNPPGFARDKKYPIAFIVHGGPQVSFQNHWNWRWNAQAFAARGYGVVFIDFHGSPGYGQAFTDSISQHWGDRPYEDLQKGFAAALQKFPMAGWAARLLAWRIVRRLHAELDRRQLARRLPLHRQS
jgi:dipeptidyl aminopeptidase/acylaminoacyl peptidase